jgi:hypothetical protein
LERGEIGREFQVKEAFVDGGDEIMLEKVCEILAFSGVSRILERFLSDLVEEKVQPESLLI